VARVETTKDYYGYFDLEDRRIDIYRETYGQVEGLPGPEDGTLYIVSALVRLALPERKDLVSPGECVRDSQGRVVSCYSLVSN